MKKIILIFAVMMFLPGNMAFAAKLTCDCSLPADNVTGAQLQFDNGVWLDVPVSLTCVGVKETVTCVAPAQTICYDLTSLANGNHVVRARFVNLWEVSPDSAPLNFIKGGPSGSPILHVK